MERIPDSRYSELIGEAYSCIPPNIAKLVDHVHFFCGTDPVYAGLVSYESFIVEGKEYSSRNWMYYEGEWSIDWIIPKHLISPTIVIPYWNLTKFGLTDVLHELGHVLDDMTPFFQYHSEIKEVTSYAKTDFGEAFAEAFVSWLLWGYGEQPDDETIYYFEKLKRGEIY